MGPRTPPRFCVDLPLRPGEAFALPSGAARHAQVLRLQPGDALTLFNGEGGEFAANVVQMGRSDVSVHIASFDPVERELPIRIVLAFGMPANERMDWLIEKATELGVAGLQPLICDRSVLRLHGERAEKKRLHWRAVAAAASEQSGRTRVPKLGSVMGLGDWLRVISSPTAAEREIRWLLSPDAAQAPFDEIDSIPVAPAATFTILSGPEGGLTSKEDAAARAEDFQPISLGNRILRADTAPIAVLAALGLRHAM